MRALSLLFLVAFVGVLGYFSYLNRESVQIDLFGQSRPTVSIPVLVGAAYLLGMLTGWAVVGMLKRSWTRVTEYDRR
ncbi:MAG: hypothetical protein K2X82_31460 [Gemmataceae bacterium]|nr:hypothetical protein [Gemmataceae bacterium]